MYFNKPFTFRIKKRASSEIHHLFLGGYMKNISFYLARALANVCVYREIGGCLFSASQDA